MIKSNADKNNIQLQNFAPKQLIPEIESLLPEDQRLLIIVDQAEELLTLSKEKQQDCFAEILVQLSQQSNKIHVLCAIRDDFFGPLAALPRFYPIFSREVVVLNAPSNDALSKILINPLRIFGYQFEDFEISDYEPHPHIKGVVSI